MAPLMTLGSHAASLTSSSDAGVWLPCCYCCSFLHTQLAVCGLICVGFRLRLAQVAERYLNMLPLLTRVARILYHAVDDVEFHFESPTSPGDACVLFRCCHDFPFSYALVAVRWLAASGSNFDFRASLSGA